MASTASFRVLYGETDAMGYAYYSNYLKWFEIGRAEWFRAKGTAYLEIEKKGIFMPVVEAHCNYLRPAFYDDVLEISTSFSFQGARLRFDYEIHRGDELITTGYTQHVCMDNSRKVQKPPGFLREILET